MWSFLFISNHLQASGWELAKLGVPVLTSEKGQNIELRA